MARNRRWNGQGERNSALHYINVLHQALFGLAYNIIVLMYIITGSHKCSRTVLEFFLTDSTSSGKLTKGTDF